MSVWSLYDATTGLFIGRVVGGSTGVLQLNLSAGEAAVEGVYDSLCHRVDLATGEVIDYVPPAPPDTALATHSWNATTKRWVAAPTAAARAAAVRAARDARLDATDWVVTRALEQGTPVPAPWLAYRQALRDVPEQLGFPDAVEWPALPEE